MSLNTKRLPYRQGDTNLFYETSGGGQLFYINLFQYSFFASNQIHQEFQEAGENFSKN